MILLIIGVGMLNFLLPAHLNSIMFLLILYLKSYKDEVGVL